MKFILFFIFTAKHSWRLGICVLKFTCLFFWASRHPLWNLFQHFFPRLHPKKRRKGRKSKSPKNVFIGGNATGICPQCIIYFSPQHFNPFSDGSLASKKNLLVNIIFRHAGRIWLLVRVKAVWLAYLKRQKSIQSPHIRFYSRWHLSFSCLFFLRLFSEAHLPHLRPKKNSHFLKTTLKWPIWAWLFPPDFFYFFEKKDYTVWPNIFLQQKKASLQNRRSRKLFTQFGLYQFLVS